MSSFHINFLNTFRNIKFKITMNLFSSYVYAVILVLVPLMLLFWNRFKNQKKRRLVGYVKEIRTHPVKSAKPVICDSIEVTKLGVKHDRLVVNFTITFCMFCLKVDLLIFELFYIVRKNLIIVVL